MNSGLQLHSRMSVIVNDNIASKSNFGGALDRSMNKQAVAVQQTRRVRKVFLQSIDQFAELLIQMQMRRLPLADGVQTQAEVIGEFIGIAAHGKEITGGLHGCETNA